jgi:hypothetical protein
MSEEKRCWVLYEEGAYYKIYKLLAQESFYNHVKITKIYDGKGCTYNFRHSVKRKHYTNLTLENLNRILSNFRLPRLEETA